MGYEHRNMTNLQRMQGKYLVNEGNGCWEWLGHLDKGGYGHIGFKGKVLGAHRFSWQTYKGKIPKGMDVLHTCDNPRCVNPDHFWLGTQTDNNLDRDRKGRHRALRGVNNPRSKLNDEKAFEIRWLAASGHKQRDLAKQYGVSQRTIACVIHHKTYQMECHD